ncbi:STAS domain-containing protein [Actinomadura soli]|uniref:STAS domain-containing protein n=1 Tax=Actinomadura soli TaxID=2508997 RepID=UPI001486D06C|nr:STAS domain-containing protein [Actinomadura soli]
MTDDAGRWSPSAPGARLRVHAEPHPGGRIVVVHVDGEIDNATAGLLREQAIAAAGPPCPPRLVLDMDLVTFCDASGLGALVAIRNAVRAADGDLVIARAPEMCRRILHRTGLDQYITVTATLGRAVTHLTDLTR